MEPEHWHVALGDERFSDWRALEAELERIARSNPDPISEPNGPFFSATTVHLRADPDAPYVVVQRLIQTSSKHGLWKTDCDDGERVPEGPATPYDGAGELHVALFWDAASARTLATVDGRYVADAESLRAIVRGFAAAAPRGDKTLLILDPAMLVPWRDVMALARLCDRRGILVEFAAGDVGSEQRSSR